MRSSTCRMSKSYYQCLLFKQFTTQSKYIFAPLSMSKSYYQCLLFKQFTTRRWWIGAGGGMSKSYYQCLLFKQFTTVEAARPADGGCQRAIINVYFSSNSQRCRKYMNYLWNVKELLSMSTFQAIHNTQDNTPTSGTKVKELLSMFTFHFAKIRIFFNPHHICE